LEEADQLADRIAVLDRGRVVAEGSPEELKRRIPGAHIWLRFADGRHQLEHPQLPEQQQHAAQPPLRGELRQRQLLHGPRLLLR
jgi:ABC-type multidrug transport system ATPase subunit